MALMKLARFTLQMLILLPILFGVTFALVSLTGNESASAQTRSSQSGDRFVHETAGQTPRRIDERASDAPAERRRQLPIMQRQAPTVPKPAAPAASGEFRPTTVRTLPEPLMSGEWIWDEGRAPDAPLRIVVDIDSEQIYAYRGGYEVGRATIIYGADHKPTPLGSFPILEKDIDHISNLYDAPMPYMLRMTWDGITIHGANVDNRYATHGCVGVPDGFAAKLFAGAKLGDTVTVTRGWTKRWG
ncbi:L,D-transpeptidase family protein [Novosphingopyxis sp.]|uniref:L,D-transpeptidase family protein n=1 Tax=Novosphingopyxis sp. TaxID=2709690 RepID=UPI003B5A1456